MSLRAASSPTPTVWRALSRWAAGACALMIAATPPLSAYAQSGDQVSLIRDAEVEDILRQDADPIFVAAGLDPNAVKIHIVGDKELNAFAAGGQQIFLNTGMIIETENPGQLRGVIAHETGHVAGGHLARMDIGGANAMKTFLLTIGLGVLAAVAGAPELGGGLVYSSGYFATLDMLGYTRVQEAQADQAAATYLEKAGLSGKGLVEFFNNFRYEEVFSGARKFPYFRSHPLSSERIEALRARVEKLPHYGVADTPEAIAKHQIMVAKLKGFTNYPSVTLAEFKASDTSFPARYARAIAYFKSSDPNRALEAIEALLKDYPDNAYLWELKGQVLFESGRTAEAVPAHRRSVELKPDQPLLKLNLGQALLAQNDETMTDEALADLRDVAAAEPDNAFAWRLMAQAYDRKGDAGMARLATAEQNFALGQEDQARIFGMRAREALPKTSPEWRRATDIVLVSKPTKDDLKKLAEEGSTNPQVKKR
jgi:predicted Zn-dependent protease